MARSPQMFYFGLFRYWGFHLQVLKTQGHFHSVKQNLCHNCCELDTRLYSLFILMTCMVPTLKNWQFPGSFSVNDEGRPSSWEGQPAPGALILSKVSSSLALLRCGKACVVSSAKPGSDPFLIPALGGELFLTWKTRALPPPTFSSFSYFYPLKSPWGNGFQPDMNCCVDSCM